ncbi:MAG: MBL fold metallo-hydrolase [Acidobacteriota bacterium]
MLRQRDYGPVRYFALARSIAGRALLTSGIYFVDNLLIDTGPSNARSEFDKILENLTVEQIVLTHHHEDHTGNAAGAAQRLGVTPLAYASGLPLLRRPPTLPPYRLLVWGKPAPCEAAALTAEIHTRNYCFEVLHTPGHAPDHVVLYEPDQRWLFTGDLYLADRLKVLRSDEEIGGIISSLRQMLRVPDCQLFCQHSGGHRSHQQRLAAKLDFLLGLQEKIVVQHEEGRTMAEITRALKLQKPFWRMISRGEFSGVNLVAALLQNAGIDV